MLTAADRLDDKASGFELGADDYLTKPFERDGRYVALTRKTRGMEEEIVDRGPGLSAHLTLKNCDRI